MLKINHVIIVLGMLLFSGASSAAQVGIGVAVPGFSVGINLPAYPELDVVPGYPVYYAPQLDANYFFYDGTYWLYQDDNWYASSWYNGPWELVDPMVVPAFVLRVPVRYYRHRPVYFREWAYDAPPHWGERWGRDWEQRRSGWDRWDRRAAPAPAPLPDYQRQYSGDRYPRPVEQQRELNRQNYRYQPNEPGGRQPDQGQPRNPWYQGPQRYNTPPQGAPQERNGWYQGPQRYNAAPPVQQGAPQQRNPWLQGPQRYSPPPSVQVGAPPGPRAQPWQQEGGKAQRSAPPQGATQYKQQTPGSQYREEGHDGKDTKHDSKGGQEQERGRDRNEYTR